MYSTFITAHTYDPALDLKSSHPIVQCTTKNKFCEVLRKPSIPVCRACNTPFFLPSVVLLKLLNFDLRLPLVKMQVLAPTSQHSWAQLTNNVASANR